MKIVTPFDHITERVIKAAYRVHDELGRGFAEKIYENAMCVELREMGLIYQQQSRKAVFYRGELVGEAILDLVVEENVLVELKAVTDITDEHRAQCINYLTCTKIPVGMLFNFGDKLSFQRFLSRQLLPKR